MVSRELQLILEGAVVRGGEIGSPHHAARAKRIVQAAEEFLRGAGAAGSCVHRDTGELQVEVGKAREVEERLRTRIGRTLIEARAADMVERDLEVGKALERNAQARELTEARADANRNLQ